MVYRVATHPFPSFPTPFLSLSFPLLLLSFLPLPPLPNMSCSQSLRFTRSELWIDGTKYLHEGGVVFNIRATPKKIRGVQWSVEMWKGRKASASIQKLFTDAWTKAPVCLQCGVKTTSGRSECEYCAVAGLLRRCTAGLAVEATTATATAAAAETPYTNLVNSFISHIKSSESNYLTFWNKLHAHLRTGIHYTAEEHSIFITDLIADFTITTTHQHMHERLVEMGWEEDENMLEVLKCVAIDNDSYAFSVLVDARNPSRNIRFISPAAWKDVRECDLRDCVFTWAAIDAHADAWAAEGLIAVTLDGLQEVSFPLPTTP